MYRPRLTIGLKIAIPIQPPVPPVPRTTGKPVQKKLWHRTLPSCPSRSTPTPPRPNHKAPAPPQKEAFCITFEGQRLLVYSSIMCLSTSNLQPHVFLAFASASGFSPSFIRCRASGTQSAALFQNTFVLVVKQDLARTVIVISLHHCMNGENACDSLKIIAFGLSPSNTFQPCTPNDRLTHQAL